MTRSLSRSVCSRRVGGGFLKLLIALAVLITCVSCSRHSQHSSSALAGSAPMLDHVWRAQLSWGKTHWDTGYFEFGEAIVSGDGQTLFIGSRTGELYALRTSDGSVIWQRSFGEGFEGAPLLANGKLYVGGGNGSLYSLNPNNGVEHWSYNSGSPILAPPSLEGDTLVFTNSSDQIFALNAPDGEFLWQRKRPSKPTEFTLQGHSGVLIHERVAYAGFSDGQLMAFSLEDGATIWGYDLSNGNKRFRDVDSTPTIIGDHLYAASFSGGVHSFDLTKEYKTQWHREVEGASTIVPSGGSAIYFSSNEGIHGADRRSGQDIWRLPLSDADLPSRPIVSDSHLFISLRRRGLLILRRANGATQSLTNPGGGISTAPTIIRDRVFVASNRGLFYAFKLFR